MEPPSLADMRFVNSSPARDINQPKYSVPRYFMGTTYPEQHHVHGYPWRAGKQTDFLKQDLQQESILGHSEHLTFCVWTIFTFLQLRILWLEIFWQISSLQLRALLGFEQEWIAGSMHMPAGEQTTTLPLHFRQQSLSSLPWMGDGCPLNEWVPS